jgi:hypothetical protein
MRKRKRTKPRPVDFVENFEDFLVAALVFKGYSTTCIADATDFTPGQITYRIGKAGLQWERHNFRNGTSPLAKSELSDLCGMDFADIEDVVNADSGELNDSPAKGKKIKPKGAK